MTLVLFSFYHGPLCTFIPTRIFRLTFTCHHVCRCGLAESVQLVKLWWDQNFKVLLKMNDLWCYKHLCAWLDLRNSRWSTFYREPEQVSVEKSLLFMCKTFLWLSDLNKVRCLKTVDCTQNTSPMIIQTICYRNKSLVFQHLEFFLPLSQIVACHLSLIITFHESVPYHNSWVA